MEKFISLGADRLGTSSAIKILNSEKIKERTAFAFFVFAVCYQTFFQFFNRTHENTIQLMIASALALFLAGVFAATSVKNLPYSILVAIIICFLDIRLASAYSFFLLTFSIVKLQLEIKGNKFRKSSQKKKNNKLYVLSGMLLSPLRTKTTYMILTVYI